MNGDIKAKILSAETLIPVGVLIALMGPLIWGTWTASSMFYGFTNRLESLERTVGTSDRWTYAMEKQSWREFHQANPQIAVPDVERIHTDWLPSSSK